nr:PREDICTED: cathepsin R-like [Bemisia tabaci]
MTAVAALEILLAHQAGKLTLLSVQNLIDCDRTNNGCMGGHTSNSLNYIRDVGIATARAYPYQAGQFGCRSNQIKPYVKLTTFIESDPSNIEGHLELSPIPTAVHHPPELQFYISGVFDSDNCPNDIWSINHGVVIVGHYRDAWIIRDTVPEEWGLQGHYLMKKGICCVGVSSYTLIEPQIMTYNDDRSKRQKT